MEGDIVVLDTETTGLNGEILEIASINFNTNEAIEDLVKPGCDIDFRAMATHHITPDMVEGCPPLSEVIHKYEMEEGVFVAHNAQFDLGMLPEGTISDNVKILCTLKLARALFDKKKFGDHKLSTLWYGYGLYKKKSNYRGVPHRARYDCFMTACVLKAMLEEYHLTIESALELIKPKPIEDTLCFMPKYRDKKMTWKEVKQKDPDYCGWLVDKFDWKSNGTDGFKIKDYLNK